VTVNDWTFAPSGSFSAAETFIASNPTQMIDRIRASSGKKKAVAVAIGSSSQPLPTRQ
jgi:hypothetical protein